MENFRKYGTGKLNVITIHGGPGALGDLAYLSEVLSKNFGVIEALQTKSTIDELLLELKEIIEKKVDLPVILLGHSWGAWLALIFAEKFPDFVKKLILISSAVFEEKYAHNQFNTRLERLSKEENLEVERHIRLMNNADDKNYKNHFEKFAELMTKADSYCQLKNSDYKIDFRYNLFQSVWAEAEQLRSKGLLLEMARQIKCPVTAIHGDYDSHPSAGVKEPLSKNIGDFKFIELEKCGHYPWKEKYAKEKIFEILKLEINN